MLKVFSLGLAAVVLVGCVSSPQVSNEGKVLNAQAPDAPAYSALDQGSIITSGHRQYRAQPSAGEPLKNAARGTVVGGVAGNLYGGNSTSTVYGSVGGGLIGLGMGMYAR
ncbi:hypothetical protein [Rappaport israeli]|uniref:hypothetical protein n=1 Tax=Rappaport israeli TaxID=1839807 RepID=UPI00093124A9|nr:hypothetical protein [Rappaport israeli]